VQAAPQRLRGSQREGQARGNPDQRPPQALLERQLQAGFPLSAHGHPRADLARGRVWLGLDFSSARLIFSAMRQVIV